MLFAERLDDAAEPVALVARLDLAGDADVIDGRHENEEPARERCVRSQSRALCAQRLLRHLDDNLLPFLQQLFDFGLGIPIAPFPAIARLRALRPSTRARGALSSVQGRYGGQAVRFGISTGVLLVVGIEAIELLDRVDDVRDIQEPVTFQPDINERALHAGEHFRYPALVEVADDSPMTLALDENLGDEIFLEDRDHRLVPAGRDDHFLLHSRSSIPDRP